MTNKYEKLLLTVLQFSECLEKKEFKVNKKRNPQRSLLIKLTIIDRKLYFDLCYYYCVKNKTTKKYDVIFL